MNRKDIEFINKTLSVLINQPLRSMERSGEGDMIIVSFGDLIETDITQRDENRRLMRGENNRLIMKRGLEGKYSIDSICGMRFSCGDEILFTKGDIFLPSNEQLNNNFDWDTFEWHIFGNNFFDEAVTKHFFDNSFSDYIVKSVKANKFGDLTITFENGFALELFNDGSGYSEAWRFGEINSTESLIINGNGIDRERSS